MRIGFLMKRFVTSSTSTGMVAESNTTWKILWRKKDTKSIQNVEVCWLHPIPSKRTMPRYQPEPPGATSWTPRKSGPWNLAKASRQLHPERTSLCDLFLKWKARSPVEYFYTFEVYRLKNNPCMDFHHSFFFYLWWNINLIIILNTSIWQTKTVNHQFLSILLHKATNSSVSLTLKLTATWDY